MKKQNREILITQYVSKLLRSFGENTAREGLKETPARVYRMYEELLSGYSQDPKSVFKTFKSNGYHDLVTVTNIKFYSLCEHHMIPFFGSVNIGYIPNGKILGLSKFARLVEILSRKLQTQENLTNELVKTLQKYLKPKGLIVSIEAEHLCMSMRGIKKDNCITKTVVTRGVINKKNALIEQFYKAIERKVGKQ